MEWISIKDRLPEKNAGYPYVLAVHRDNLPIVACYGVWGDKFTIVGGGEDSVIHEITHWMPLPAPPHNNQIHQTEKVSAGN